MTVHELNQQARRSLHGCTACELFAGAKRHLRGYTHRVRREAFDSIKVNAMNDWAQQAVHTRHSTDAAWCREVKSRLQQEGVIVLSEPKVLPSFPENWSHK